MKEPRKPLGRPPAGKGAQGEPEKVSNYPKLAVSVQPLVRAMVNAVAMIEDRPAWRVVEDAIRLYVEKMPSEDRKAVEAVVRRAEAKQG